MPAGFKNHPSRTPAAAAENQIQGRTEACRYLVLLGMDPRLPDGEGSDAFKLAEGHPSVKSAALNLAAAVHRRAHRRSGDGGPGAGGLGGGSGPGGRPAERAPTAGSSAVVRGESEADDVEKGSMSTAGDAGDEERGAQPRRRSAAEACSWGSLLICVWAWLRLHESWVAAGWIAAEKLLAQGETRGEGPERDCVFVDTVELRPVSS